MFIKSIKLTDFGVFSGSHCFPLTDKFNHIFGPNGSGKTTILTAIRFVIDAKFSTAKSPELLTNNSSQVQLHLTVTDQDLIVTRCCKQIDFVDINGVGVPIDTFHKEISGNFTKASVFLLDNSKACKMNEFLENDFWEFLCQNFHSSSANFRSKLTNRNQQLFNQFREVQLGYQALVESVLKREPFLHAMLERNEAMEEYKNVKQLKQIKVQEIVEERTTRLRSELEAELRACFAAQEEYCKKQGEASKAQVIFSLMKQLSEIRFYNLNQHYLDEFKDMVESKCLSLDQERVYVSEHVRNLIMSQIKSYTDVISPKSVEKCSKEFQIELFKIRLENSNKSQSWLAKHFQDEKLRVQAMGFKDKQELLALGNDIGVDIKELEIYSDDITNNFDDKIEIVNNGLQDFWSKFEQIRNLSDSLKILEVKSVKWSLKLREISFQLGYDGGILNGLHSVTKLVNSIELADEAQLDYLGPVFDIVHFKFGSESTATYYFKDVLQRFYPCIMVKTARFAQKLMKAFNENKCPGEIDVISMDIYAVKSAVNQKPNGISLADFIEDDNPLKPFFSTFVVDLMEPIDNAEECFIPDSNKVDLEAESIFTVHYLEVYLKTQQELDILDRQKEFLSSELKHEKETRVLEGRALINTLQEITLSLGKKISEILHLSSVLNSKLVKLFRLTDFNFKQYGQRVGVLEEAMILLNKNQFKIKEQEYEDQFQSIINLPKEAVSVYLNDNILNHVLDLSFSKSSIGIINVDYDFSKILVYENDFGNFYEPEAEESLVRTNYELQTTKTEHVNLLKSFITKYNRMCIVDKFRPVQSVKVGQETLDKYGHKTIDELDLIIQRLESESAVDLTKKDFSRPALNTCQRIIKNCHIIQGLFHSQEQVLEKSFNHRFLQNFSLPKLHCLNKVLKHVKMFIATVKPFTITDVEIVCKLKDKSVNFLNNVINFDDLTSAECIFITQNGFIRFEELHDNAKLVFYLALYFGVLAQGEIKTLLLDDLNMLDHNLMEKIVDLFSTHGIQIILTGLRPWPEISDSLLVVNNIPLMFSGYEESHNQST